MNPIRNGLCWISARRLQFNCPGGSRRNMRKCQKGRRVGRVESISAPLPQLSTQKGQRITPWIRNDLVYNNNLGECSRFFFFI